MEESLALAQGRIHGISPTSEPKLGPVVATQVELEGIEANALLDTGSPASMISLEFLTEAKLSQKPEDQSHEEWKKSFKPTVHAPEVTLQSYGGSRVFTVGQTEVTISPYSLKATVQVQRNAPVPLLGTNLQPMLGFMFLKADKDGSAVDLLNNGSVTVQPSSQPAVACLVRPYTYLPTMERW